jgi:hypothetical protein
VNDWAQAELGRLRTNWPQLRYDAGGHWVLIPGYHVPEGWNQDTIELAVRIPENLPGQEPYGFWVRGGILLADGRTPSNYTFPSESLPFEPPAQWGQFSWSLDGWAPGSHPGAGTGMVHFVQSIYHRLEELN